MKSTIELEKLFNEALEPHAKELGLLIHAWNQLHTEIASLYLGVCQNDADDELEREILLAIWNAVPNDRMQRHMVRMAAKARFGEIEKRMDKIGIHIDVITKHEANQLKEIIWILDSADKMGRKRDDSAHLPVIFYAEESLSIRPQTEYGNPIAGQFVGTDIVAEFSLTRARINVISQHALAMWRYLFSEEPQPTLPQRPEWPTSPRSSVDIFPKAPSHAKQPKNPPQS